MYLFKLNLNRSNLRSYRYIYDRYTFKRKRNYKNHWHKTKKKKQHNLKIANNLSHFDGGKIFTTPFIAPLIESAKRVCTNEIISGTAIVCPSEECIILSKRRATPGSWPMSRAKIVKKNSEGSLKIGSWLWKIFLWPK